MLHTATRYQGAQEHLDRAPLVHRVVALGGLRVRELEVEDLAWVDLAVPDQVDQLEQESSSAGSSSECSDSGSEDCAVPPEPLPRVSNVFVAALVVAVASCRGNVVEDRS